MHSRRAYHQLLLHTRFAVLGGHLIPPFLSGSLCKLLGRFV